MKIKRIIINGKQKAIEIYKNDKYLADVITTNSGKFFWIYEGDSSNFFKNEKDCIIDLMKNIG